MPNKLTQAEFILKLEYRNANVPDEHKFVLKEGQEYVHSKQKITVICSHGHEYNIKPNDLFAYRDGNYITCGVCYTESKNKNLIIPFDEIVQRLNTLYNSKYQYVNNGYENTNSRITIICPVHGEFTKTVFEHLYQKQGCSQCWKDNSLSKRKYNFIKRSKKFHNNKYNYDNINYVNFTTPISIQCPVHGEFTQTPNLHVNHGCPKCAVVSFSKKQIAWLEYIMKQEGIIIHHALNGGEIIIPNTSYRADGYCEETNTIYEFHGDYYHGNLDIFSPEDKCHPYNNKTAQELYDNTQKKHQILLSLGYNVVYIWEYDFDLLGIEYDDLGITPLSNKILIEDISYLGVKLTGQFFGYKKKHKFECLTCGGSYETTLTDLKRRYKKFNKVGCPKC
jgi:hypothetical protein